MNLIMTPDDPDFYNYLHSRLPPGSTALAYAPDPETGILRPLRLSEEKEYYYEGRLDHEPSYVTN